MVGHRAVTGRNTPMKFLESLVAFACLFLSGLCISLVWKWFAVPLGLPVLGVLRTVGLMAIPGLMAIRDPDKKIPVENFLYTMVVNLVTLGIAYIIHLAV